MPSKVLVYVEGQTEEIFVKRVLVPHLGALGIHLIPTLAKTKRTKSGHHFKGGITSYERTRRDILALLGDTSAVLVTTMIDYYGLPGDFPGRASLPSGTCFDRVAYLEEEFRKDIGRPTFRPYFQLHEFEALVFVDPSEAARAFPGSTKEAELVSIRSQFGSPEEIDDGETTAPSKRLRALFPGYQKPFHSPLVAVRTGLARIRSECRHFSEWMARLEQAGGPGR
jgi:hypothetical protein